MRKRITWGTPLPNFYMGFTTRKERSTGILVLSVWAGTEEYLLHLVITFHLAYDDSGCNLGTLEATHSSFSHALSKAELNEVNEYARSTSRHCIPAERWKSRVGSGSVAQVEMLM